MALPDNPRRSLLPSKARALTLAGSAGRRGGAGHASGSRVPLGSPPREETTACSRVSLSCWEELPVCLPSASNSAGQSPEQTPELGAHLLVPEATPHCPVSTRTAALSTARGDLTHSPRGGHLPGTAPAQGSAQPPTSPATADTGAFPRPEIKGSDLHARQKPLLTRFPGSSSRRPFCPIQQIQGAGEGCLPTAECRPHAHNRSPGPRPYRRQSPGRAWVQPNPDGTGCSPEPPRGGRGAAPEGSLLG